EGILQRTPRGMDFRRPGSLGLETEGLGGSDGYLSRGLGGKALVQVRHSRRGNQAPQGGVDCLEPFVGSAGEFGPGTPVRGVSRTREWVAPGVSTASAAPGWQGRPAFGVSRCQTGESWRIQKCQ